MFEARQKRLPIMLLLYEILGKDRSIEIAKQWLSEARVGEMVLREIFGVIENFLK